MTSKCLKKCEKKKKTLSTIFGTFLALFAFPLKTSPPILEKDKDN